jgi:hypothetical protein
MLENPVKLLAYTAGTNIFRSLTNWKKALRSSAVRPFRNCSTIHEPSRLKRNCGFSRAMLIASSTERLWISATFET